MATTSIVIIIGHNYYNQNEENTIKETFQTLFNSDVYNWIGLSYTELRANIRDCKTNQEWLDRFNECKFIVIFYLSSTQSDGLDGNVKDIRDVKRTFFNPLFKIRQLNEKLKWLVVPSCCGNLNYLDIIGDISSASCLDNSSLYLSYYFISYCTVDNPRPNRENEIVPSLFIQVLCKELRKNAHKKTLVCILNNVNEAIEQYARNKGYENFPCPVYEKNCGDYTLC